MARAGVIEPSCSSWASNVVVVAKHDKTPRISLDYRALNSVTYKDFILFQILRIVWMLSKDRPTLGPNFAVAYLPGTVSK